MTKSGKYQKILKKSKIRRYFAKNRVLEGKFFLKLTADLPCEITQIDKNIVSHGVNAWIAEK